MIDRLHGARARFSLRLKLTLWMLAIAVVIQTMVTTVLLIYQRRNLDDLFNDRLATRAQGAAAAVREQLDIGDGDLITFAEKSPLTLGYERCVVSLYDKDGLVLASSVPRAVTADAAALQGRLGPTGSWVGRSRIAALESGENPRGWGRMAVQRIRRLDGSQCVLFFGTGDTRYEAMMNLSLTAVLIAIPTGALATGIAGWLVGGLAIAPLRQLARVAHSLLPDSAEPDFDPPAAPPELAAVEKDLQETRTKLREAFLAQDRFISNVAHEIKTPIAVLLAEAETLPKNDLAAAERVVHSAREEMERLGRMVEGLLSLTRLRGGQGLTDAQPCQLNEVVMSCVESCALMARQHGVVLSPQLSVGLPLATVVGEYQLLKTMMDNLVRNAIRFSPANSMINIGVEANGEGSVVTVRDRGPGIPVELLGTLFDRFVQGAGESQRGHGLGLAIGQGIAELHGGRIAVRNIPEGGCEFTVRFPRSEASGA